MNALEQARLALQKKNDERCKVEEVTDVPAAAAPSAETQAAPAPEPEQASADQDLVGTAAIFTQMSPEKQCLNDMIAMRGGLALTIMNVSASTLLDELFRAMESAKNITRLVARFDTLTIAQFTAVMEKYTNMQLVFYSNETNDVFATIRDSIGFADRISHVRHEGSITQQLNAAISLERNFKSSEIYNAFLSNNEFREKLFFCATNETAYHSDGYRGFLKARLLNINNVAEINTIYVPYKLAQLTRHDNAHYLVNNTIVSDYHYNDALAYAVFLMNIEDKKAAPAAEPAAATPAAESTTATPTAEPAAANDTTDTQAPAANTEQKSAAAKETPKLYRDATALVAMAHDYSANITTAKIICWNTARLAELRSRLHDLATYQQLNENIGQLSVTFTGTQQALLAKAGVTGTKSA